MLPLGAGWNSLKVDVKGDLFIVYLNCDEIFRVQDNTFAQAGKVGLWTKADVVFIPNAPFFHGA